MEVLVASPQQGPDGAGPLGDVVHLPLAGAVPKEGPIEAGVGVLHQLHLQQQKENSCQGHWEMVPPVYSRNVSPSLGWFLHPACDPSSVLMGTQGRAERGQQQKSLR